MDNGAAIFWVLLLLYAAWLFYMMTFRTRDFLDLTKADQERKQRQAKAIGSAAKFGFGVARMFMKK